MNKNELINVEKQEVITKLKNEITLEYGVISKYGNEVSKKLADFSTEILKDVKIKDTPEVEELLLSLVGQLNSIDCTTLTPKKQNFISKLLGNQDIKTFVAKYETVQQFITGVSKKLLQAEYALSKDIELCNENIEKNREYIEELSLYIEAANQKLAEVEAEFEIEKANIDKEDLLAVHELSLKESDIQMLKRKVHNLGIQRMVAIQNIPQLKLIRDGNAVLVEKINSSIETSIPLWENQMAIAIKIMRESNGAKLVKSITDTNNELLKRNASMLKTSSIAVATELERDIVDLETLKMTNTTLIETIQEIRKIRNNGEKNREAVALELKNLQTKLIACTTD